MQISRRSLLFSTAVIAASAPSHSSEAPPPSFSDLEIDQILREEVEPTFLDRAVIPTFWYKLPPSSRPQPIWPDDLYAFDYSHIADCTRFDSPFTLSANNLTTYLQLCNYPRSRGSKLIFGLRGASLADGSDWAAPAATQTIVETRPDHIHPKCLIGVLDRQANTIALAAGSTVPNVDLMMVAAAHNGAGCNMLPTGYHPYRVGPHRGSRQPGAFRQQSAVWVHRSKDIHHLSYSLAAPGNFWDDGDGALPMDDIHAAMLSYNNRPPYFSSAGCQVVKGSYAGKAHQPFGPWAEFRKAAGLHSPIKIRGSSGHTVDDGSAFDYLLLTGREAGLVATGRSPEKLISLRFGAEGEAVRSLQRSLGVPRPTPSFDRHTMAALIAWQSSNKYPPVGILTAGQAIKLGVKLD